MSPLHEIMDTRACRALWAAVLTGLLRDLCGQAVAKGRDAEEHRTDARQRAEAWVGNRPSRSFLTVCDFAGLDGDAVHERLRALIDLPVEARRRRLAGLLCGGRRRRTGKPLSTLHTNPGSANIPDHEDRLRTLSPPIRRDRVAAKFKEGVAPSKMPAAFAAEGLHVPITTVQSDIQYLRKAGRIGYARQDRLVAE